MSSDIASRLIEWVEDDVGRSPWDVDPIIPSQDKDRWPGEAKNRAYTTFLGIMQTYSELMWGYEPKILHPSGVEFGESPRLVPQTYSAILRGRKTSGLPDPWRLSPTLAGLGSSVTGGFPQ